MSKYRLITETIETINFHEDGKRLFVQGIYSEAEKKNPYGRGYTKELLEREVENFQKRIPRSFGSTFYLFPQNGGFSD
jgi:hypothetical protein